MNREIKFRAKTTANGHWVYGWLIRYGEDAYSIQTRRANPWVEASTIGQYTGLRDSNGHEIYEGDIVSYYDEAEDKRSVAPVEYHSDVCSYCIVPEKSERFGLTAYCAVEVVGNIHDNPTKP